MKRMFYLLGGILIFSACQTQQLEMEDPSLPKIIYSKAAVTQDLGTGENIQYLEIALDPSGAIPELLLVRGHPLYDDGNGFDLVAGDNIYSSIEKVTFSDNNANSRVTSLEWYLSCNVDASLPGGDCGGGSCPGTTAWGNSTWFCICLSDCSFCIGSDCNKK